MWNRLSNIAQNVQTQLDTVVDNVNKSVLEEEQPADANTSQMEGASPSPNESFTSAGDISFATPTDAQEQLDEQSKLIGQLKNMIRQRDKELTETNAKLSKIKLQAKAKISTLNTQIQDLKKAKQTDDGEDEGKQKPSKVAEKEAKEKSDLHLVIEKMRGRMEESDEKISLLEDEKEKLKEEQSRLVEQLESASQSRTIDGDEDGMQALQRRLQEVQEVLSGREKVVEILQTEVGMKEKMILEQSSSAKAQKEKLDVMQEQFRAMQETFVTKEQEWNLKKEHLENQITDNQEKHEKELMEKDQAVVILQSALSQYETAYNQASDQYKMLAEQFERLKTELEDCKVESDRTKSEAAAANESQSERLALELAAKDKLAAELQESLSEKEKEVSEMKEATENLNMKAEAKMTKLKTQAKAKLKHLEEQLEELRKADSLADEVSLLKNKVTELEDEKGNLQLKLVDYEESLAKQGSLEDQVNELEQKRQNVTEEKEELKKMLHARDEDTSSLEVRIEELNAKVEQNQIQHDEERESRIQAMEGALSLLKAEIAEKEAAREDEMKTRVSVESRLIELLDFRKMAESHRAILEETISGLEQEKEDVDSKLREAERDRDGFREEKVTTELKMIEIEEERDGLVSQTVSLQEQVQDLKHKMESEFSSLAEMEKANGEMTTKIEELEEAVTETKQHLEEEEKGKQEVETKLARVAKDNSEFQRKLQGSQEDVNRLTSALENAQENLQGLTATGKEQVDNLAQTREELTVLKGKSQENEEILNEKVTSLEEKSQRFEEAKETANTQLEEKEKDIVNLMEQLSQRKEEVQAFSERFAERDRELAEVNVELTQTAQQKRDLESVVEALKVDIQGANSRLGNERNIHAADKGKLISEIQEKITESDDMSEKCSGLQEKLDRLSDQYNSVNKQIQDLKSDIVERDQKINSMETVTNQRERELDLMREGQSKEGKKVESKMSSLLMQISELENEVTANQNRLSEKELQVGSLQQEVTVKSQIIANKESEHGADLIKLKHSLEEKETQKSSLQEQVMSSLKLVQENEDSHKEIFKAARQKNQDEKERYDAKLEEANKSISDLEGQRLTLQHDIKKMTSVIDKLKCDQSEQSEASLKEKCSSDERQRTLELELTEKDRVINEIEIRLNERDGREADYQKEIERLCEDLSNKGLEAVTLSRETAQKEEQVKSLQSEIDSLRNLCESKSFEEDALSRLQESVAGNDCQIAEFQEEIVRYKTLNAELQSKLHHSTQLVENGSHELKNLQEALTEKTNQYLVLMEDLDVIKGSSEMELARITRELSEEKDVLEEKYLEAGKEKIFLENQLKEKKDLIEELTQKVIDNEDAFNRDAETQSKDVGILQEKCSNLKLEAESLSKELDQCKEANSSHAADLEAEVIRLQEEVERTKAFVSVSKELEKRQKELDELKECLLGKEVALKEAREYCEKIETVKDSLATRVGEMEEDGAIQKERNQELNRSLEEETISKNEMKEDFARSEEGFLSTISALQESLRQSGDEAASRMRELEGKLKGALEDQKDKEQLKGLFEESESEVLDKQRTIEALEKQVKTLEEDFHDQETSFNESLSDLNIKVPQLTEALEAKSSSVLDLGQKLEEKEKDIINLSNSLSFKTEELDIVKDRMKNLVEEPLQRSSASKEEADEINELKKSLGESKQRYGKLLVKAKDLKAKFGSVCEEKGSLNEELTSVKQLLEDKVEEVAQFRQEDEEGKERYFRMESDKSNLKLECSSLKEKLAEKDESIHRMRNELESVHNVERNTERKVEERLQNAEEDVGKLNEEIGVLGDAATIHQSEKLEAMNRIQTLDCEVEKLNESLMEQTKSMASQKDEADGSLIELGNLRVVNERLQSNIQLVTETEDRMTKLLGAKEQELEERSEELKVALGDLEVMTGERHELETSISEKERDLKRELEELSSSSRETERMNQENAELEACLKEQEQKCRNHLEHVADLEDRLGQSHLENTQLKGSFEDLTGERDTLVSRLSELQEECKSASLQKENLTHVVDSLEKRLEENEKNNLHTTELNAKLKEKLLRINEARKRLSQELATLKEEKQKTVEDLVVRKEGLEDENMAVKREVELYRQSSDRIRSDIADRITVNERLTQENKTLKEEVVAAKEMLAKIEANVVATREQHEKYKRELSESEEFIQKVQGERDALAADISRLTAELDAKTRNLGKLHSHCSNLEEKIKSITEKHRRLKTEHGLKEAKWSEESANRRNELEALENEVGNSSKLWEEKYDEDIKSYSEKFKELETVLEEMQTEKAELERDKEESEVEKERLYQEIMALEGKVEDSRLVEKKLSSSEERLQEAFDKRAENESFLTETRNNNEQLKLDLESLESEKKIVADELQKLRDSFDISEKERLEVQSHVEKLESERDVLNRQLVALESTVSDLRRRIGELAEEKERLEVGKHHLEEEQDTLMKRLDSSSGLEEEERKAIEVERMRMARVEEERDSALKSLHHREMRCESLSVQVAETAEEKNNLTVRLKNQERMLQSNRRQLSEMQDEISRLQQEKEEKEASPETLQPQQVMEESVTVERAAMQGSAPPQSDQQSHSPDSLAKIQELIHLTNKLEESDQEKTSMESQLSHLEVSSLQMERDKRLDAEVRLQQAQYQVSALQSIQPPLLSGVTRPSSHRDVSISMGDDDDRQREPLMKAGRVLTRQASSITTQFRRWIQSRNKYCQRSLRTKPKFRPAAIAYTVAIHIFLMYMLLYGC